MEQISIGVVAFALLLLAQLTFGVWLQGRSIAEYVASRDTISGVAYVLALGLFALMPLWV